MNPFIENFDKMKFDCSDELKKRFQECKSCQIVGSGPCEHRHLIDQHDLVVKVNR